MQTNTNPVWAQYETRLDRVIEHIHTHLDDELDMDGLAQIACLSPWHWHRIYRGVYGETITATVKRLRLHRAANELVKSDMALAVIGQRAGYPNLQSFNRTFKKAYGLPPGKYRLSGGTGSFVSKTPGEEFDMFQVEIRQQDAIMLAGLTHKGPYSEVGIAFEKLNGLAASRGMFDASTRSIGIYYDDPSVVAGDELRSFACLSVGNNSQLREPLVSGEIAGGKYAVFRYMGPWSNMESCYRWIYEDWMKTAQCEIRDEPAYAEYLNPMDKSPHDLLTDIYLPLV